MTDIKIICVGRVKERYFVDGIKSNLKEIRRYCPMEIIECEDEATPDGAAKAIEDQIRTREGRRILGKIKEEDYVSALCIDGTHYSTESWRNHVREKLEHIQGSYVMVIGGSLGLSDEVIRRANEKLSFSAMTFPHQMMRLILCEQIAKIVK